MDATGPLEQNQAKSVCVTPPRGWGPRSATRTIGPQQVEDLDREIAKLIEADDDWEGKARVIDSVPGIGPDTANQLVV